MCQMMVILRYLITIMQVVPQYKYKVKLHNSKKRKKAIVLNLHGITGKYTSVNQLKSDIRNELRELRKEYFDFGYFETRQESSKVWVVSSKDLEVMYEKSGKEVYLWVTAVDRDENDSDLDEPERKRTKRQSKEDELDDIFYKLKLEHGSVKYSPPQLKLWARMISNGTHDDYKSPPRVPMITGMQPKQPKKDVAVSDVLASAVVRALSPPRNDTAATTSKAPDSTDIRMKNFQQLRLLQQLYDDKIITASELSEQKTIIMEALRKL